jgi:predicted lipid-binding transport protein (Tim44 family)
MAQVLRLPLDPTDGNLIRSQVTAAIGAVNAQLRADEQQLKRKRTGDVFERLLKIIEQEKKARPECYLAVPQQQIEQVELERSEAEASVTASGGDGSEEGH